MAGRRLLIASALVLAGCSSKPKDDGRPLPTSAPAKPAWKETPAPIVLDSWQWPAIGDLNGDGIDDVVALGTLESAGDTRTSLAAYDGKDGTLLWLSPRIQPAGSTRSTRALVFATGEHVALANGWQELELFSAKTGAREKKIELDGIPGDGSCADPAAPEHLFLTLFHGTTFRSRVSGVADVDLVTGEAASSQRPAWCPAVPEDSAWQTKSLLTRCGPPSEAPELESMLTSFVLSANGVTIAAGVTPGPRKDRRVALARFDPATKRVLWQRTIPKLSDPPEGYGEDDFPDRIDVTTEGIAVVLPLTPPRRDRDRETSFDHLALLDLVTGTPRFELRSSSPWGVAGSMRAVHGGLYIMRSGLLEVRDPATGAVRRSYGREMVLDGHIVPK